MPVNARHLLTPVDTVTGALSVALCFRLCGCHGPELPFVVGLIGICLVADGYRSLFYSSSSFVQILYRIVLGRISPVVAVCDAFPGMIAPWSSCLVDVLAFLCSAPYMQPARHGAASVTSSLHLHTVNWHLRRRLQPRFALTMSSSTKPSAKANPTSKSAELAKTAPDPYEPLNGLDWLIRPLPGGWPTQLSIVKNPSAAVSYSKLSSTHHIRWTPRTIDLERQRDFQEFLHAMEAFKMPVETHPPKLHAIVNEAQARCARLHQDGTLT